MDKVQISRRGALSLAAAVGLSGLSGKSDIANAQPEPAAGTPLTVPLKDIDVTEGVVSTKNESLANSLVQRNSATIGVIKSISPSISAKQISIDTDGKVIIRNKDFADKIAASKTNVAMAKPNGVCGLGCTTK